MRDPTPQATPEERYGGMADARHANVGEVARPYSWEGIYEGPHGPYGAENDLLGFDYTLTTPAAGALGQDPTADLTPRTHAAPWPKGVPQSPDPETQAEWRAQEASIHASNTGASRRLLYSPTSHALQDSWQGLYEVDPGDSAQDPNVPKQVGFAVGTFASRDRAQSLAGQNQYGYDAAHLQRRYATGSIPGNYMWMQPGGRPLVKNLPGTAQVPVGNDSPFAGQSPAKFFDTHGAVLTDLPYEYSPPPQPAVSQPAPSGDVPEVAWW
jgi:hypothetical protein